MGSFKPSSSTMEVDLTQSNHFFSRLMKQKEMPVLIALLVLCVVLSFSSEFFLTSKNIFNVLRQFSVIAILAVGQALIIITGGIDLSVGSLVGLMGICTALLAGMGLPAWVIFIGVLLAGCIAGSINGLLVTKVRINPFIVTLGMLSIAKGVSLLITGGLPISIENAITFLGSGYISAVPVSVIIMFLVVLAGHIFATRTLYGRNIYAVGNNERAAKLSGIRVDQVKIMVFVIMGALCALSGIILSGNLSTAEPAAGTGYELDVIAAVVIGGASLAGGQGSIIGVILGAAIMGVLRNGFVLLEISAYWQVVTIGLVIIAAVALDSIKNRKQT
ncbi:monosaccharide ABC transporter membrane protein, CUT2 family [Seinonella peptonophila]|uniref:Monosaccharide ABC transporter membrane protein, CUT2 family n=1 Tax=Seinonella peptonophila TaxID=112248 RepID=A0A1M4T3N7_9BACL|nr:ABC transporter permease [Seinonella peptonophila]SHE39079.1 monosaccharide ABC transporter membrane protein, CUT2 family [Seinonella peptonophila]